MTDPLLPARLIRAMMHALMKAVTATPTSTTCRGLRAPLAAMTTTAPANRPPASATQGWNTRSSGAWNRVRTATAREAPEATPSSSGPASGFLRPSCIIAPAKPSAAPLRMASATLGARNSRTASHARRSASSPQRMPHASTIESLGMPLARESEAATKMHRSRPAAIRRSLTGSHRVLTGLSVAVWLLSWACRRDNAP